MKSFGMKMAAVAMVCVAFTGCGGKPATGVTGHVNLDGKPLAGAQVQFMTDGTAGSTVHGATTDELGAFTVVESGKSNTPFKTGKYIVLVTKMGGTMDAPVNHVPARYGDSNKTPLKIEVTKENEELKPFELKTK